MARPRPSRSTYNRLYSLSGNCCAFPGCKQRLFDEKGNWFGEACHIEAAAKAGPRTNSELTSAKLLSYNNLIVLCSVHHNLVDHDETFTVTKLKKMKKAHEKKFVKKSLQISDNLLEKLIKAANKQYEQLYEDNQTVKKDIKEIRDILFRVNLEKKPKKNVHTFTGKNFTISWPDSWTIFMPHIPQKELSDTYFGKNTDLKFSNPEPVIQIRSKKRYFGIYPAALASVTLLPKVSLENFIEFVKDGLKKLGYDVSESYVEKIHDIAIIITSKKHDKTTSYFCQKLQIHKGRLFGFIISELTSEQIKKAPKLMAELKQIAQSFSFTD